MKKAHLRILQGIGHENFKSQVFDRFPLALDDASVLEVAESIGWDQAWLQVRRVAAAKPPPMSQNVAALLVKAGPAAVFAPPQGVGASAPGVAPGVAVLAQANVPPLAAPPAKAAGIRAPAAKSAPVASPSPAKAAGHHVPKTGARVAVMAPPSAPVMAAGGRELPKSSAPLVATLVPRPSASVAANPKMAAVSEAAPAPVGIEAAAHPNETGEAPVNQTQDAASSSPALSCVFCMDNLMDGQARTMLRCGHVFHSYCVNEWRTLCNKLEHECPMRCHLQQDAETESWEMVGSVDGSDDVENPDRVSENPLPGDASGVLESGDASENPGGNAPHDAGAVETPAAAVSEGEILAAAAEVSESVV
eukprot:s1285_g6.t1